MLVEKIKKISAQGEFVRNVLTLMTGTTVAQFLPILTSPLLTRLYSPEDFGVLALYTSICLILTVLICAGYEFAVVMPEKDEEAINLVFLCGFIATTLSLLLLGFGGIFGHFISSLSGNNSVSNWLHLAVINVFLTGINQTQIYWASRKKQFKRISNNKIINSIILVLVSLILGMFKFNSSGLILGALAGQTFATLYMCLRFFKEEKSLIGTVNKKNMLELAQKYSDFPKFSIWSTWINTISIHLPVFVLSAFFSNTIAGFYSISHRFVNIPISLIGTSSSQVFIQKASENKNDIEKLGDITYGLYKKLLLIGIIPFSVMMAYGDVIFPFIFGGKWAISGQYAQMLSLFFLFAFVSSPISTIPSILYKQKTGLVLSIILVLSRFLPLFLGAFFIKEAFITIAAFAIISAVFRCGYSAYILNMVKIPFKNSMGFTASTVCSMMAITWTGRLVSDFLIHIKG